MNLPETMVDDDDSSDQASKFASAPDLLRLIRFIKFMRFLKLVRVLKLKKILAKVTQS